MELQGPHTQVMNLSKHESLKIPIKMTFEIIERKGENAFEQYILLFPTKHLLNFQRLS